MSARAWLVVRATDAGGAPLEARVELAIEGEAGAVALDPVGPAAPGAYERELPRRAARLLLRAARPGAWGVEQPLAFDPEGDPPSLVAAGAEHAGVRSIAYTSRGPEHNLEVHVVLGRARCARARVLAIAGDPPRTRPATEPLAFPPRASSSLALVDGRAIVSDDPEAEGLALLRFAQRPPPEPGRIFFLERPAVPRLVIACVPAGLELGAPAGPTLDFHVALHPAAPEGAGEHPFAWRAIERAHRALFAGKRIAYQHEAARKAAVLVFPVGAPDGGFGEIESPRGLLDLLRELAYFLPRLVGGRWPRRGVGRVALSGFASAVDAVRRLIAARADPAPGERIAEVYDLDGEPSSAEEHARALAGWVREGGRRRRVLRVYHRDPYYAGALAEAVGGEERRRAFPGFETVERAGERGSVVILPAAFWARVDPRWADGRGREAVTNYFAYDAVARSGFADL